MVMSTAERAEVNRRNAQKSTGPRTAEGKEKSRLNALRHGMTATAAVLPGEDAGAFQARVQNWTARLAPESDLEEYLVKRAARVSWQLDRIDRAHVARLSASIHASSNPVASAEEREEVVRLGRLLFWDRRGPTALYPTSGDNTNDAPRTSWSGLADDPTDPARIVIRLEATLSGCEWLIERWLELSDGIVEGIGWLPAEKLRAIRLLGKQPIEAITENVVAAVFAACHVLAPHHESPFAEMAAELRPEETAASIDQATQRAKRLNLDDDHEMGREVLLRLVDGSIRKLKAKADAHRQAIEERAAIAPDLLGFDATPEGERLRRYETSCARLLHRTLHEFNKLHQASAPAEDPLGIGVPRPNFSILRNEASADGGCLEEAWAAMTAERVSRNEASQIAESDIEVWPEDDIEREPIVRNEAMAGSIRPAEMDSEDVREVILQNEASADGGCLEKAWAEITAERISRNEAKRATFPADVAPPIRVQPLTRHEPSAIAGVAAVATRRQESKQPPPVVSRPQQRKRNFAPVPRVEVRKRDEPARERRRRLAGLVARAAF